LFCRAIHSENRFTLSGLRFEAREGVAGMLEAGLGARAVASFFGKAGA
jgi:hypothetical protein